MSTTLIAEQPRWTDLEDAQYHLNVETTSIEKSTVLLSKLLAAEEFVEHYTRRRFAPEPALADPETGYQRRLVAVTAAQMVAQVAGQFPLTMSGNTVEIPANSTAAQMQALLNTAWSAGPLGGGSVVCSGGPLPSWPVSVTFAGTATGVQPAITTDPSALGPNAGVVVQDCGFDSLPPVLKRFSTRGQSTVRIPDLRMVDGSPDPRMPGVAGVTFYGQRLLPGQYLLGFNGNAPGGADDMIGSSGAEPSTEIQLGWGYGASPAQSFSFVLPVGGVLVNDLQIAGRWGWNPVPNGIRDATYAVCARLYRERDAAYSDQLITAEGNVYQFFKQLPASTQGVLDYYRVMNIALLGA